METRATEEWVHTEKYKKMGEMSQINWHNLEVRYINKHGKVGARRKKIISSNPEMLRKFKNAVDVMMVG